jgi:hypothetical protein
MQKKLNLKIKYREGFRPFAPSVLEEDASEYFDIDRPQPYMLFTTPVRTNRRTPAAADTLSLAERLYTPRSDIPSITHLDYSARVQTVSHSTNDRYTRLIRAFKEKTGYGLVVNTSFNVRGEPMVMTPEDAYRCFMNTERTISSSAITYSTSTHSLCGRKRMQPRHMVWIKNTLLVLASITVTLGALEVVLHLSSIRYAFLPPLEPRGYVRYDSVLGFDIAPDVATTTHQFYDLSYPVWSNELGCFDMPYHGETPFIYMTGDSFTWGWTPFQDKWGTQLQALLGLRTLKCGVNAYGTRHEYLKTERDLVRLSAPPKFVILGYLGGNDADDDAAFPEYVGYDGLRIPTPYRCLRTGKLL